MPFRDINFFQKVSVTNTTFSVPIEWNFVSVGMALMVESNNITDVIQYSFDGVHVHGDMTPTLPSEAIIFDHRAQDKIWFRLASPGGPVAVRLETWRT